MARHIHLLPPRPGSSITLCMAGSPVPAGAAIRAILDLQIGGGYT